MKRFVYFITAALLMVCASCKEDWLNPEPLSFFSPENVFTSKAGYESVLVALRKDLKQENTGTMPNMVMEFASSDLGSPWSQLDFHRVTPSSDQFYRFLAMFTDTYAIIKNANVIISRIDNIAWSSEQERNAILAEAYWHRAYWYYRLVHSFGDVPFINEEIVGAKLDFYSHSRMAILDKIQADLEYALEWLPESAGPGEITKGAVNHLLTKVYLSNLEFDKAIAAATRVINGPYSLMRSRFGEAASNPVRNLIWDLHRPNNFNIPQNRETILAIVDRFQAPPAARSVGLYTMRMYNPHWHQTPVLDSEGKRGMIQSGPMYDSLGRGNANVRLSEFYTYDLWTHGEYTWKNTPDLRRADINWVDTHELLYNNPASVDFGKPINKKFFAVPADTFIHVYAIPHYIVYVPQHDPQAVPVGGNGDWYIFRLAEAYLLRAEAYFHKGMPADAANDINAVRERANAPLISAGDVTIDYIFDERARELMAEEPRHSELVRASFILATQGKDGYSLGSFTERNYYHDRVMRLNISYQKKVTQLGNTASMSPFHVLWPIPSEVITANTLGVINQNKGYDGAENNLPPLETIE